MVNKPYLPKVMRGFKNRRIPQLEYELNGLLKLMREERVTSYLEIGLRHATTFQWLGARLPRGSRLTGIDWPGSAWGEENVDAAREKIAEAAQDLNDVFGQDVYILLADSKSDRAVEVAVNRGPFDLVFIDGDHSYDGVKKDWELYSSLSRIVAFHDIDTPNAGWMTEEKKVQFGVHTLWSELVETHRHRTIVDPNMPGLGIGVVWTQKGSANDHLA